MNSTESKQVRLARAIATVAHHGQFRRDGKTPYITHPEAVAAAVSVAAKPAAWCHDVGELGIPVMIGQLLHDFGLHQDTIDAVLYLTKPDGPYLDYIQRLRLNAIAREVKIADIKHNLSCQPTKKNAAKYALALEILEAP
jgi:hypothetical protein